jgi:hypothetical protein
VLGASRARPCRETTYHSETFVLSRYIGRQAHNPYIYLN